MNVQAKDFQITMGSDIDLSVPFQVRFWFFSIGVTVRIQYKPSTGFLKVSLS